MKVSVSSIIFRAGNNCRGYVRINEKEYRTQTVFTRKSYYGNENSII